MNTSLCCLVVEGHSVSCLDIWMVYVGVRWKTSQCGKENQMEKWPPGTSESEQLVPGISLSSRFDFFFFPLSFRFHLVILWVRKMNELLRLKEVINGQKKKSTWILRISHWVINRSVCSKYVLSALCNGRGARISQVMKKCTAYRKAE